MVIIDSSKIEGARVLVKFIRRWKLTKSGVEVPSLLSSAKFGKVAKEIMLSNETNMEELMATKTHRPSLVIKNFIQLGPSVEKIVEKTE